jgi:hypothetical protein
MESTKGAADSIKEELGWLKVLFAVLAAADASLIAWLSQNYMRADRLIVVPAGVIAIAATAYLLWINRAVGRRIAELKTLSWLG